MALSSFGSDAGLGSSQHCPTQRETLGQRNQAAEQHDALNTDEELRN
jgi:hypothetical protein